MKNLRLSICRIDRKCIDYEGEWDGKFYFEKEEEK